jgi:hypothetical protein
LGRPDNKLITAGSQFGLGIPHRKPHVIGEKLPLYMLPADCLKAVAPSVQVIRVE